MHSRMEKRQNRNVGEIDISHDYTNQDPKRNRDGGERTISTEEEEWDQDWG